MAATPVMTKARKREAEFQLSCLCSWKAATTIPYPSLVSWRKYLFSLSYYFFLPTFCPLCTTPGLSFSNRSCPTFNSLTTTFVGSLPTFHGIFEEEVIHIEDSCSVRLLGAQDTNSLDQVIYDFVHIIREDCHIAGTQNELSEHTPHLQPFFSLTGKQDTRIVGLLIYSYILIQDIHRHIEDIALFL